MWCPQEHCGEDGLDRVQASTQAWAPPGNMCPALSLTSSVLGRSLNLSSLSLLMDECCMCHLDSPLREDLPPAAESIISEQHPAVRPSWYCLRAISPEVTPCLELLTPMTGQGEDMKTLVTLASDQELWFQSSPEGSWGCHSACVVAHLPLSGPAFVLSLPQVLIPKAPPNNHPEC